MKAFFYGFTLALSMLTSVAWGAPLCTAQMEVTDVIGPATEDFLNRVQRQATQEHCDSILLLVNTPGGSLQSTRAIVETILNSPLPYLCLVAPSGGHAGSAGAIILQACHVNGALKGTNLGAATPVAMGQDLPKDLRQKILNDTRSWLESLTSLRGRSEQFGKDIILEAKAVTADEAFKLKAVDFTGDSIDEFIRFAAGRKVKLEKNHEDQVRVGPIRHFEQDTRYKVLSLLTDPEWAYMILLASLALLYFEATHTGVVLPGVVGGLGLVVALVSLHKLDVEWGGLLLILIGVGLLIAEMFIPAFGVVGAGGLVALVLGSVFLFDPARSFGYHLPYTLIFMVVSLLSLAMIGVSWLVLRSSRLKKKGGFEDLMGRKARVVSLDSETKGQLELRGEIWSFECKDAVQVNDTVLVLGHDGLVLQVNREV